MVPYDRRGANFALRPSYFPRAANSEHCRAETPILPTPDLNTTGRVDQTYDKCPCLPPSRPLGLEVRFGKGVPALPSEH